jgi:hypothetical protein
MISLVVIMLVFQTLTGQLNLATPPPTMGRFWATQSLPVCL